MQVISQSLFALPVYAGELLEIRPHIPALIDRIDTLREENRGMQASNRHAFHSMRDFHLADDPATNTLHRSILEFARVALEKKVSEAIGTSPWEVQLSACWAVAAEAGGFLVPHNHFPSPWAGVVYLEAEHTLEDGPESATGCLDLLCPVPLGEAFGLSANTVVHPRDTLAVLFPGALQHAVHPHRSRRARYSVSFNALVKPKK
jgi:uncharacterized protein (TIGR02466 family)